MAIWKVPEPRCMYRVRQLELSGLHQTAVAILLSLQVNSTSLRSTNYHKGTHKHNLLSPNLGFLLWAQLGNRWPSHPSWQCWDYFCAGQSDSAHLHCSITSPRYSQKSQIFREFCLDWIFFWPFFGRKGYLGR